MKKTIILLSLLVATVNIVFAQSAYLAKNRQGAEAHISMPGVCKTSGKNSFIYLSKDAANFKQTTSDPYTFKAEVYVCWTFDTYCRITNVTNNNIRLKVVSYTYGSVNNTQYVDIDAKCCKNVNLNRETDKIYVQVVR